jgi:predicted lipid-binding transport protein (Tim44 family)
MSRFLAKWRVLLVLAFGAALVLAPTLADARAGRSAGGSFSSGIGSRGLRSYEFNGAAPLSRSTAPRPGYGAASGYSGSPGYGGGGFWTRHPFLTGIAGGLVGSWLFGGHGYAATGSPGTTMFGSLLHLLILGLIVYGIFRLFRRRRGGFATDAMPGAMPRSLGAAAAADPRGRDIAIADADLAAFQHLHAAVQDAWSHADLARLRPLMTPEMLGYFSEELTRNASQGVQNIVSDVALEQGDLSEGWAEGDLQYATARMRWRALDYLVRLGRNPGDPGYVADGDPTRPVEATEVWTFVRGRGGNWLLSAIQQT